MSLFKRKDTWWCDFTMHGDRYRESLKTRDKREAIAKEKERIAEVQAGTNLAVHRHFARWPFSQAADFYIEDLKLRLAQSSVRRRRSGQSLCGTSSRKRQFPESQRRWSRSFKPNAKQKG